MSRLAIYGGDKVRNRFFSGLSYQWQGGGRSGGSSYKIWDII